MVTDFLRAHLGRPLSPTMLEVLATDSLPDAPDAADEFGVERTPLREGLGAPA